MSRTPEEEVGALISTIGSAAQDARVAAIALLDAARRLEAVVDMARRIQSEAKSV